MGKKQLILVPSSSMDSNKKKDRNENGLVRMSATARDNMGFIDDSVELWPDKCSTEDRMNKAVLLGIFHAFKGDIKQLKGMIRSGELTEAEAKRVGFVTTKTYNRICGNSTTGSVWISKDISDTVIGSDPEFVIVDPNDHSRILFASDYLPKNGQIGHDAPLAEIRPKPEISPEALVANMTGIFSDKKLTKAISEFTWLAGCYFEDPNRQYTTGTHIHVGNPKQLVKSSSEVRNSFYKVMNKILDELLALPMIKADGSEGPKRRTKKSVYTGYGFYGGFRTEHGRLEHRTLSGMAMLHPMLTVAVFGTAKAIIDEAFRRAGDSKFDGAYILPSKFRRRGLWKPEFNEWDEIPLANDMQCITGSEKMLKLLTSSDSRAISAPFLRKWYTKLRSMSTYNEYSKYIDGLYEILKIKTKELTGWDRRIKKNWLEKKKFIVNF